MEREHINPDGVYKHPAFTRVVTVKIPASWSGLPDRRRRMKTTNASRRAITVRNIFT
ncbi:MAG: hypothetical protein ACXWKA_04125 [Xanthobacteraceae bacterium]